jgi:hypothetical protein
MRRLDTPPYGFALPDETHLRALFEQALHESDAARLAFREAVCSFTKRAKGEGAPIERIIAALKDMLGANVRLPARGAAAPPEPPPEHPSEQQLVEGAVRACIDQYYET